MSYLFGILHVWIKITIQFTTTSVVKLDMTYMTFHGINMYGMWHWTFYIMTSQPIKYREVLYVIMHLLFSSVVYTGSRSIQKSWPVNVEDNGHDNRRIWIWHNIFWDCTWLCCRLLHPLDNLCCPHACIVDQPAGEWVGLYHWY